MKVLLRLRGGGWCRAAGFQTVGQVAKRLDDLGPPDAVTHLLAGPFGGEEARCAQGGQVSGHPGEVDRAAAGDPTDGGLPSELGQAKEQAQSRGVGEGAKELRAPGRFRDATALDRGEGQGGFAYLRHDASIGDPLLLRQPLRIDAGIVGGPALAESPSGVRRARPP